MKPIILLTSGTRGDVQPIVALAKALQAAGKPVKIAAPPAFGRFVAEHGLPFAAVEGNPSELMTAPGGHSALTFDGNPLRSVRATLGYLRRAQPLYAQMLLNATQACREASALVIGLPTTWGAHLAEAFGIPCIGAFLQPVTPTAAFPAPLLPFSLSLGGGYNRLSYRIASLATWFPWMGQVNTWRRTTLGLNPLFAFDFLPRLAPLLYGFSPNVIQPQPDWPPQALVSGYWPLQSAPQPLPASLQAFLQAGEAPLYIGFGSPGVRNPHETVQMVCQAVKQAGMRAIFSLPDGAAPLAADATIYPLTQPLAHDRFFAHLAGIVHHGGAGTTAAGLLAGLPSLLCPLAMDQFFWAGRVEALGVGPRAVPQRDLSAGRLAEGLVQLKGSGIRARAQELAQKLQAEKGLETAVNAIVAASG